MLHLNREVVGECLKSLLCKKRPSGLKFGSNVKLDDSNSAGILTLCSRTTHVFIFEVKFFTLIKSWTVCFNLFCSNLIWKFSNLNCLRAAVNVDDQPDFNLKRRNW